MTHGSSFSGIGGFDLAAEWVGWQNLFNCEIDPFCKTILKYYWPNAEQYSDIRQTDFTIWRGRIDVLSGGFPCQPFSQAGKRKGTEDERHLWPEMLRAIREIQPRWVVGENVLGIVNWSGGMVFEQVCADLEAEGYEVQPYILPAAGVGAPHQRYRVWFIAHSNGSADLRGAGENAETRREKLVSKWNEVREFNKPSDLRSNTNTNGKLQECGNAQNSPFGRPPKFIKPPYSTRGWQDFPTQPPVCGRDDEFSGRLHGITFPKWRQESIKGYGNAVVPQVVLQIFETINEYEALSRAERSGK